MAERQQDRQLDRLVDLLTKNATVVMSGTKLATQLGVSPSTLWEWIERLRSLGVEVRGLPGAGYQLKKVPDILTPQAVRRSLHRGQFGCQIYHFYETDSTMTEAERLAGKDAPHGTLVIAEEQTAGRGRFGRQWFSEPAVGIYFTLILRPRLAPSAASILTLLAGVALAEIIHEICQLPTDLRWPNDVLIREKKCAGILVEMTAEPERIAHILMGIGVNVNHPQMPKDLTAEATSLHQEAGRTFSRLEILSAVLKRLERYYLQCLEQGPAVIVHRFSEISSFARGKRVRITDGPRLLTGETAGLSPEGILLLRRDDGQTEMILGGQVRAE
ncbi:MAG: biotin--[acetyl-CoA-carboxylase] ligase [Acidobacteria bacterium]|nr:biotin--[acetyl-CoA-carboxylase] ligase [Acidobacteriota bacterium]